MITPNERRIIEAIRDAHEVKIIVDCDGGSTDIHLKVGGRMPHDVAIALQSYLNNMKRDKHDVRSR